MNFTYILRCADDTLYCGWTNDLEKRLKVHNEGKGAKYTRSRLPVTLVYYEIYETSVEAQKREYQIKRLTRQEKLSLISAWPKKKQTNVSLTNLLLKGYHLNLNRKSK